MDLMTRGEAAHVTELIRAALDRVSTAWGQLGERISEAYQRRADLALGYNSWAEYAEAELKPAEGLAADVRRQLVGLLSAQGMSTRAIAPTVGVTDRQVRYDAQVGKDFPPVPGSTVATRDGVVIAEQQHIDLATGEVLDIPQAPVTATHEPHREAVEPVAPRITGLDGKTYTRPERTATRRRPLPDVALDAAHALTAAVARMERVFTDDRYPQNKEQVARYTRHHLPQAVETLQRLADEITQ